MAEKITKKDRLLLEKLDENARLPLKKIAKAAGMSPEAAAYRMKRLEQLGCVLRYHTVINYFKLGYFKYKLYLRLKSPQPQIVREICEYFRKNATTEWVSHNGERWDVIVGFVVQKPNDFADEVENFMSKYSETVLEKAVTQTLYLGHQSRFAEEGVESKKVVYHTMLDKPVVIDALDKKILQAVANNARASVKTLAKMIGSTPRKVAYRMIHLEKEGVILAYKAHLDPKKFGNTFYKIILYLKSMDKAKRKRFIEFCGQLPSVVWPQQVLGSWDFEIDMDAPDNKAVYETIAKILKAFPDIVLNHEQSAQIEEYKLDFFPGAYPAIKEK